MLVTGTHKRLQLWLLLFLGLLALEQRHCWQFYWDCSSQWTLQHSAGHWSRPIREDQWRPEHIIDTVLTSCRYVIVTDVVPPNKAGALHGASQGYCSRQDRLMWLSGLLMQLQPVADPLPLP